MKKLAYITALILSLLIIYSGAGVSIMHYCCARCETAQGCCDTGCPKCKKTHTCDSKKDCKAKGCTATIYKLDLMKHTTELKVLPQAVDLFYAQFCYLLTYTYSDKPIEYDTPTSPPPLCSRQKLALYATYLI
ncbi:hypothetical protein [Bacteroides acidifaciens]|uniref:hypothetical protein n=1 Tax=Bacteroides acidifaciens TaxID=85831 RepID=UPI00214A8F55|nr:hypothetical protein [Bacteroides acidifaciens]MCR1997159.1 hypothetical protein [Bacteroides acidifaciens]